MQTYRMQERERTGYENAETILGIVILVVLVACGFANVPMPSRATSEASSISLRRDKLRAAEIQELRTRDGSLEAELRRLSKAIETTKSDFVSFRQVHDTLIAQVATTTAKLQEFEGKFQDGKTQATKINEYAGLQEQLKKERDEALTQAKDAAERVRELTLRLQRAGVYP
jgi:chromosome segregation ATPase